MSTLKHSIGAPDLLDRELRPNSDRDRVVGWLSDRILLMLLAGGVGLALLLGFRAEPIARKLVGAILPGTNDTQFPISLLHHLAVAVLISLAHLAALRVVYRSFRYNTLGHWMLLSSLVLAGCLAASYWWYVDDDAAITFAYSRNLAQGLGLVRGPGELPLEGYSNPLWMAILAGLHWAGADIIMSAKLLAVACMAGTLLAMWHLLKPEHPLSWLALPLALSNAALVIWSSSGLENGLHMLLLAGATASLAVQLSSARLRKDLPIWLALLVLSRPEGLLFTFAAVGLFGWTRYRQHLPLRQTLWVLTVPLATMAALTLFRYLYFGDLLPNTYYAKGTSSSFLRLLNPFSGGWMYVFDAARAAGWTLALVPLLLLALNRRAWTPTIRAAVVMIAAQMFFVVSVGGDWMLEHRFMSVIVPLAGIVVVVALAHLAELVRGQLFAARPASILVPAIAVVCPVLVMITMQIPRLIVFAHNPTTPMDTVTRIALHFEELGRQAGLQRASLLTHDAGGTSYLSNLRLIDLGGLCDRTIARQQHDREAIGRYIFQQCRPDFIYSAKVFADRFKLDQFPEFERDYRPLPPPADPLLQGYLRHVRADLYPKLYP